MARVSFTRYGEQFHLPPTHIVPPLPNLPRLLGSIAVIGGFWGLPSFTLSSRTIVAHGTHRLAQPPIRVSPPFAQY